MLSGANQRRTKLKRENRERAYEKIEGHRNKSRKGETEK